MKAHAAQCGRVEMKKDDSLGHESFLAGSVAARSWFREENNDEGRLIPGSGRWSIET
jgi:hypothetical protein